MITNIILCGGKGTRLKPLTEFVPKPLILLHGKPCLQYIIESSIRKGFKNFVLCIGYRGRMIVDFIRKNSFDARFQFSDAGEEASLLERLYQARTEIGERAFVTYGDTLIDADHGRMLKAHEASRALLTLTTIEVRSPFGLMTADPKGRLLQFEEKPVQTFFAGHMLLERSLLDDCDPSLLKIADGGGLVRLIQDLAEKRRVRTFPCKGPRITFNTRQDLDGVEGRLDRFFTQEEEQESGGPARENRIHSVRARKKRGSGNVGVATPRLLRNG